MAPFRDALGGEVLACPTSAGTLQLELAPHHTALVLANLQLVIARGTVTLTRALRRGVRREVRLLQPGPSVLLTQRRQIHAATLDSPS